MEFFTFVFAKVSKILKTIIHSHYSQKRHFKFKISRKFTEKRNLNKLHKYTFHQHSLLEFYHIPPSSREPVV